MLGYELAGWGQHLGRMEGALEQAAREAQNAVRLEAAGIVPSFDLFGALAPWQRWPDPSPPLPFDWASTPGPGSVGVVWVDPSPARQLAEGMRTAADQLRGVRNRVATALLELAIDTPLFLEPIAASLEEIAGEMDRRVTLLEQVDRELAGAFRHLAEGLGFPGLAPPRTFDVADPVGSSVAGLRAGPDAGPGLQPTQAKEADPVSTSTGSWDEAGRLVSLSDATGETTWELDQAGRPAVEHRPQGIDLHHRYDTLGRRNRLELRRADVLVGAWEYGFDADGRITGVLDPSGATSRLRYDRAGRPASLHHPNGVNDLGLRSGRGADRPHPRRGRRRRAFRLDKHIRR